MGLFHQWIDRDKFKEIFRSHWESFKGTYSRYRAAARYEEAVQKMLGCGDPSNGYATYVYSGCGGDRKKVPFSCKGCFCLSCGKIYTDQWAARIEAILFPGVAYRHAVLTVPDELRIYFYRDAGLLSELMKVGIKCLEDTLSTVFRKVVAGGYIVVVQTNGRSGGYNPHLHIIMTAGGLATNRHGARYVEYILEKEGDIAAVIAEPNRSTPYIPKPEYWQAIRQACNRQGPCSYSMRYRIVSAGPVKCSLLKTSGLFRIWWLSERGWAEELCRLPPPFTFESGRNMLSAHKQDGQEGFCRHGEQDLGTTISGVLYHTASHTAQWCAGNRCEQDWVTLSVEDTA